MNIKTKLLVELWMEARTRFSNQIAELEEEDLKKRLPPAQNSIGFLIRHIGDVELLFAKNVFGDASVKATARTVIDKRDTGQWTDLEELKEYVEASFKSLKSILERQTDEDWETLVHTNEFGTKTKAEALGRVISHTAYHAGQIAIINKYAKI